MYDIRKTITVYLTPDQEFDVESQFAGTVTASQVRAHQGYQDDATVTLYCYRTYKKGGRTQPKHMVSKNLEDLPESLAAALKEAMA